MSPTAAPIAAWFDEHRAFLWGLSYRMTGSAADADDIVQDTFVRACRKAPAQLNDPRGWLMRIAINLGRDVLRRRKRQAYVGPWLPTPVDTDDDSRGPFEPLEGRTLESLYDLRESASVAFLHALEALTPTQRAVLLLRDAFDYSAAEVATVIATTEGNVRIIHHRARRAMESYERRRSAPPADTRARTRDVLRRFVHLLTTGDVKGIEQMLAADVKAVADGGGEFSASRRPIVGALRVARFFSRLAASRRRDVNVEIRSFNGLPGALFEFPATYGRRPPRLLLCVDINRAQSISNIWVIASSAKLARLQKKTGGDHDDHRPRLND